MHRAFLHAEFRFCQGKIELDYADFQQYALVDEHHLAKVSIYSHFERRINANFEDSCKHQL